jgi:hypothetical protein
MEIIDEIQIIFPISLSAISIILIKRLKLLQNECQFIIFITTQSKFKKASLRIYMM